MIDVSVIIVNYNVRELLENCLSSLLRASRNLNAEIIIVDNNSYDGSAEYIKSKFCKEKRVKLIESKVNLGFGKANNLGAEQAKGKYLLILNPDTVVQEDTLEKSIQFYESISDAGAVSCKLLLPSGKLDLACRRSFPTPAVAVYRIIGLSRLFPGSKVFGKYNLTYLDANESYEVDSICGAFMLIGKETYDSLGGFDKDYFMYGEDIDLCYRLKKAGYKVYYFAGTSTIHFKGSSTRKSSLSYVKYFYDAMEIFAAKNLKSNFTVFNLLIKFSIIYRAVISYLSRFFKNYYPAFLDLLFIIASMFISIKLRFESFPIEDYNIVIIIYSLVWILTLSLMGTYKQMNKLSIFYPLNGVLLGFFINSSLTYYFNEFAFSRAVVLRTTAYSLLMMVLWRMVVKVAQYVRHKNIFYNENYTLIIGRNVESERFVNKLRKRVDSTYNILGYISTNSSNQTSEVLKTDVYSSGAYVGNFNNLEDIIVNSRIKNIIFARDALTNQQMLDTMWSLRNYNLNFKLLSGESDVLLAKSPLDKIDDIYLMQIEYNINKKFNILVKRLFDLVFGFLSLIFIYPFVYIFLKNRKENDKFYQKILSIPSVIKGDLSIVGRSRWDLTAKGKEYLGKNGLTGLVQINSYKKLSEDEVEYFNFYYAKNQSLLLDMEIIIKTLSLYLFRKKIKSV